MKCIIISNTVTLRRIVFQSRDDNAITILEELFPFYYWEYSHISYA